MISHVPLLTMPLRQRHGQATGLEKDAPKKQATKVIQVEAQRTVHWDELPQWLRDNQHIISGYRPASASFRKSFHSLTYVHNETVNIYSHLLPSLFTAPAAYLFYRALSDRYDTASNADVAAFSCFFAGAAFCLGMSALYHTVNNHSPLVARVGNACDYVGIVGLITGSFVPSVYYGFYCMPGFQKLYWSMICFLGLGCATVSVTPRFRTPEWRPFRATMFVFLGSSAVFPVCHGIVASGLGQMQKQIGLSWVLLQGFLYILGAVIYAMRVPEKIWPGRFDILGSSHQIFHVLVVLAAVSHFTGLLRAFDYRHSGLAPACL